MIKTIIVPENNNIYLHVPNNYIGKEVEVLVYTKEEIEKDTRTTKKTMKDLWGIISDETAESLREQVAKTRDEWEERLTKQS